MLAEVGADLASLVVVDPFWLRSGPFTRSPEDWRLFAAVVEALPDRAPHLRHVALQGVFLEPGSDFVAALVAALRRLSRLCSLSLRYCDITAGCLAVLLPACSGVAALDLCGNPLELGLPSGAAVTQFSSALDRGLLPELVALDISRCGLSVAATDGLAATFARLAAARGLALRSVLFDQGDSGPIEPLRLRHPQSLRRIASRAVASLGGFVGDDD